MVFIGTKTFAADNGNFDLTGNQQISAVELSGVIDTYQPVSDAAYQIQNADATGLQPSLKLDYRGEHRGPGHGGGYNGGPGSGYYGPRHPLWFYTVIGIIVVDLLTEGEFR